ncbi:hypothetical protein [uncultured Rothia sp.]|uniref:hypothetical protein n=1 Tax=uncultured Rothia sp. TaxID=316088 RepID=UPI003216A683
MRKILIPASFMLLALVGCSSDNNSHAPENSASATSTVTIATKSQSNEIESQSSIADPSSSETPVNALPEKPKTSFSGTTLKGNDLNFFILPDTAQKEMNDSVRGTGATGSWGALCSNNALPDQLAETGVITSEFNGGHSHVWRSLKYVADEASKPTEIDDLALENIMNGASEVQLSNKQCIVMNSALPSAGSQGYFSAIAGQYANGQLSNTVELY